MTRLTALHHDHRQQRVGVPGPGGRVRRPGPQDAIVVPEGVEGHPLGWNPVVGRTPPVLRAPLPDPASEAGGGDVLLCQPGMKTVSWSLPQIRTALSSRFSSFTGRSPLTGRASATPIHCRALTLLLMCLATASPEAVWPTDHPWGHRASRLLTSASPRRGRAGRRSARADSPPPKRGRPHRGRLWGGRIPGSAGHRGFRIHLYG